MSILVESRLSLGSPYREESVAWHPKWSIVAVAAHAETAGGSVAVFDEDARRVSHDSGLKQPQSRASALAWHPEKKLLAVGWSSGHISFWNIAEAEAITIPVSSRTQISHLAWSSNGFRILAADIAGLVVEYKIDHRGGPHSSPFAKLTLPEAPSQLLLRPPPAVKEHKTEDGRLARLGAAELENGDALDMFSRSKGGHEAFFVNIGSTESATFFIGGQQGGVFAMRESGALVTGPSLGRAILRLLFFQERSVLILISEDMMLHQFAVSNDCVFQTLIQVKINEKLSHFQAIWTRSGILAMSSGEGKVRLWDLEKENNCLLTLAANKGFSTNESVQAIGYCRAKGILAAGTRDGRIGLWRYVGGEEMDDEDMELRWSLQKAVQLSQDPVAELSWASNRPVFAALTSASLFSVAEQPMLADLHANISAVQTGRTTICVSKLDPEASQVMGRDVHPEMSIKGLQVRDNLLLVWDMERIAIYEVNEDRSSTLMGSFNCSSVAVAVHGQSVYTAEAGKVQARTFQGTVKQTLGLGEEEGAATILTTAGNFLLVATANGYARIYDLSRREAKLTYPSKCLQTGGTDFGSLLGVSLNSSGSRVAYTLKSSHGLVDPRLYVYDAEADGSWHFNLATGVGDAADFAEAAPEAKSVEARFAAELRGRVPGAHSWDAADARLLAVHALDPNSESNNLSAQIVSFFVTPEHGILVQDVARLGKLAHRFVGLAIPFYYFIKGDAGEEASKSSLGSGITEEAVGSSGLVRRVGREFVGLEKAEESTREAMLNFSYHLTTGNMDEAFKAIKLIKSEAVWENMAEMCVKTQRLDVAGVCLGRMGDGKGARMLRLAQRLPASVPAAVRVAALAVQLGHLDDAVKLYHQAGRYDLLNKLYQTRNQWKHAVELSGSEDRIHMRNTFYNYAQHLESVGAVEGAIENYEKSDTQRFEVPRMLFDNPLVLEQYVKKKRDPYLEKWWAQYLESLGAVDAAREFYQSSRDYLSVVRLLCFNGELEEAGRVVRETRDQAAAYHLARHYEMGGDYAAAVDFFASAQAFASAIRLCKEQGLTERLGELSLMSSEGDMLEAARYYEDLPGQADKAVMLYHKAGMFGRALDLAFRTEQSAALDLILGDLGPESDPNVLVRAAEFFRNNQQHGKAAQLLAYAQRHKEAVKLCVQFNVPLSEELAELLTPSKEAIPDVLERNRLLEEIADFCISQGQYHYAAKKYTQAGMKTEAMRALLKSGDTEKIVFFATTARSKDIYVMAGNFLQAGDWKSEPERMKQILSFYTKAGRSDLLGAFYHACAQVEIDDFRDYEKALAAVQEAVRCLAAAQDTAKDALQVQERIQTLNHHSALMKNFLNIRSVYESDPAAAMAQLTALAAEPSINDAVRLGDIYAVLIIHNVKKDNYKKAHTYIEELRKALGKGAVDVRRYVKPQILRTIYEELNLPLPWGTEDDDGADNATVQESIALRRAEEIPA